MTNAPSTRKTHVIRIFGTNEAGDVLPDIWVDVERWDVLKVVLSNDGNTNWQGLQYKLLWLDDPNGDYEPDGNPSRKVKIVKVCDPSEEDLQNPTEWIPIPTIVHMKSVNSKNNFQGFVERLINDEIENTRKVEKRRILHYDTNIDSDADAAASAGQKVYVVSGDQYTKDLSTKDEDQYVEHEVMTSLKYRGNSANAGDTTANDRTGQSGDQGRQFRLLNQYLIDESDEAQLKETGLDGFNPPYRLDPYQNIVNVQLTSAKRAVAGVFDIAHSNATSNESALVSEDGSSWSSGDITTGSAASGMGYTVIGTNSTLVAFGKPRDGSACFIAVQGAVIRRGILNNSGQLEWSTISSLPIIDAGGGAFSCSFAGGAFFISYKKGAATVDVTALTWLAVSFDGQSFDTEVNAFPGVIGVANPDGVTDSPDPDSFGGRVAYDKKSNRYVTTGNYTRWFRYYFFNGDVQFPTVGTSQNFMSAVSSDGLNWSAYYDKSQGNGFPTDPSTDIEMRGGMPSSVCFGKGVFVAATSYTDQYTFEFGTTDTKPFLTEACSVATSRNGLSWNNTRLPGTNNGEHDGLVDGGDTYAVQFIKTSGFDGFFVAAGVEFVQLPDAEGYSHMTKFWFSDDGFSWSLVHSESEKQSWIISAINKKPGKLSFI